MNAAELQLEWFGCTTFRLRVRGLTLFFDTYVDRINAVTVEDVQRVAQQYLHPEDFVLVVVGPSQQTGIQQ